ncbi:MAG: ATP-binding protein [Myxococcota bacterium]|nr:ATP-binding protein [Myxococcota bacterium]
MGAPLLDLRFPARATELKPARHAVKEAVRGAGCSEAVARDIVLALDEACQNVIRYAYGPERAGDIGLTIEQAGDQLVFVLTDWAPPIDRESVQPRDLDDVRPGGLGTHLIREVMDQADFVDPPSGCGNVLRMVRQIA